MAKRKRYKQKPKIYKPHDVVKVDAPSGDKNMQVRVVMAQRALLTALKEHRGHIARACEQVGLTRQTYYNYLKDPDFAAAVDAIKEGITDDYVEALHELALDAKVFPAVKYYLDNHGRDRGFGNAEEQAPPLQPVQQINVLSNLSPELLNQLKAALISAKSAEKV